MASGDIARTIQVSKEAFWSAISSYESYPDFVDGVKQISVERNGSAVRVSYVLSIIKEVKYSIDITEDKEAGKVSWVLHESDMFNKNDGGWEIVDKADGTIHVKYCVDVEFKIPVPGFILKKLVKGSLPTMMNNFEKRAKELAGNL